MPQSVTFASTASCSSWSSWWRRITTLDTDARPMASRSAVWAVSATAKRQSSTSMQAFSGSHIIQNSTASTSSGTRSLVSASSAPKGVAVVRWSTRSVLNSMSGMLKKMPGPARRLNRPRRMITARSHSRHTWTEDSTPSPTMSATAMPTRLKPPATAYHSASTARKAASASTTVTITAPLRVAFLLGSER